MIRDLTVHPLVPMIGAEVPGVDLGDPDGATFARIRDALPSRGRGRSPLCGGLGRPHVSRGHQGRPSPAAPPRLGPHGGRERIPVHAFSGIPPKPPTHTTDEGLVRGIRRWDLLFLVLNAVIGAGIFGLPARVYALVGAYSLLGYVACAAVVVLIILCFAEVASRFRTTGGPYLYALETFGPTAGFAMGWLLWLARLTAFAALCNLWIDYAAFFVPSVGEGAPRAAAIIAVVTGLTVLNVRGVRASTVFNDTVTVAKLAPLALFVVVGAFFVDPARLAPGPPPDAPSFSSAVLLLVFAFSGFEMVVIPAGESKDPRRHAPFALLVGIAFIAVLYLLIQLVSIGTLPDLATSERPLAEAAAAFMGAPGGALIAAGALVSITGTLNVIVLVGPRLPFAMAEHGQLPRILAAVHPRYRTPHVSILASSAVLLVLTLQGTFISALTISTLIRLVTYAATCAALPLLRWRADVEESDFTVPAGVAVAVAATALCGWLILTSGRAEIRTTVLAAGAGLAVYLASRWWGGRRPGG